MPSKLDNFTSTGVKFWKHPNQMFNYLNGYPQTVISTHIAPEGACNLDCSYCSVHKRKQSERLDLRSMKGYVVMLREYGLKAVILTGGGEPTAYKHFNELVKFLHAEGLKIGLITNGTLSDRVEVWDKFDWVRVSLNIFKDWQKRIDIPKLNCTVGCSYIYTGNDGQIDDVVAVANRLGAEYIRVLPDCRHTNLPDWHKRIDKLFDDRFMHQYKDHEAPQCDTCHQSYFRPYLHESGFIYPCDSVVLNQSPGKFLDKYRLCHWSEIDRYLEGEIKQQFSARRDCQGCVFTHSVNMLDDWKSNEMTYDVKSEKKELRHAEFV